MKVASVTVMATIQGFTADRSAVARGKGTEAVIELISVPMPLMRPETDRSHKTYGMMPKATVRSRLGSREMRKCEQTRQKIIRKAAPIFNQRGYEGAALSELMKATGLEKGGIYRHFASKQQLAAEAFDYAWNLVLDTRFAGTQEISNTVDRLKQVVRNLRDRNAGLVPGGCPLLNTAIDSDDGDPQLRERARRALSSWLDRLRNIIKEGQRRGEVRSDADSLEL